MKSLVFKKTKKSSFAVRLSLRFMVIVALSVFLLTVVFLGLINFTVRRERSKELKNTALGLYEYVILQNEPYVVPYEISWSIFYEQKDDASDSDDVFDTLFDTNDPFLPKLPVTEDKTKEYFQKDFFTDGDLNILYFSKDFQWGSQNFIIVTAIDLNNDYISQFLEKLPVTILLLLLPILLISFLLSVLITKQTIKPVVKITQTANKISSSNLEALLPVTGRNDEIDDLSQAFNQLFSRLNKDFARERQFSSDVSHELKTPLAVILGQTNLLLRWGKDNPKQLEDSLLSIKAQSKSMESIIENLLQMSRYESGRLKPQMEQVNIYLLFDRLKTEFSTLAPQMELKIDTPENLTIFSDEELLHQIFTVLISNSIKFAGSNCCVILKAFVQENCLYLQEGDNGPGIPQEIAEKIFERFFRGDEAHVRSAGGAGLGLSIAKTLVTVLGGQIKAEKKADSALNEMNAQGALFTISFCEKSE